MRAVKAALGKGLCVLIVLSAGGGAQAALGAWEAEAADADVYVLTATVTATGISTSSPSGNYTLSGGGCVDEPIPSPVGGKVPTYVDASPVASGVCSSFTGSGNLSGYCDTGTLTAGWTMTEPPGDNAVFDGEGVIVSGVAVLAGTPSSQVPGLGYWDPSNSTTPGSAVAVAVFTPSIGVLGCNNNLMSWIDAVVVASY